MKTAPVNSPSVKRQPKFKWQCRLCGLTSKSTDDNQQQIIDNDEIGVGRGECLDIFGEYGGLQAGISAILRQHFDLPELVDDGQRSNLICQQCWSITEQFHTLYTTVLHNERRLLELKVDNDAAFVLTTIKPEHQDLVPTNGQISEQQPMLIEIEINTDDSTIAAKVEEARDDETGQHLGPITYFEVNIEQDNIDDENDEDGNGKVDSLNDDTTNDSSTADGSASPATLDDDRPPASADVRRRPKRHSDASDDHLIRQYFNMNCTRCAVVFDTIEDAFRHYRATHEQSGFLMCCDRKFFRRCLALEHIQRHTNPQRHPCTKCNRQYATATSLQSHLRQHQERDKLRFACERCAERFETQHTLTKHRRRVHGLTGSKEFGCDICGKFFLTKSVLANHIRGVHENAFAHMCHICAKTFKSKQVYELHQRAHMEQAPPKLQCTICGSWLKHEHSLRKHMARHDQQAEVCKLCNKVAPNSHALANHMRYVHSERAHKCTMCEKAFKKPIGLREHMASHTGVDLYSCPYCPKSFKSNANMHSHRKQKHLELWQHDREQRKMP